MTDILFEYNHILMRAEYKSPDIHKHLASHLVFGLNGELSCVVRDKIFQCSGVFIASDVEHTIYAESGDMLVFLFDPTSDMANDIDAQYLKGKDYALIDATMVQKLRDIWSAHGSNLKTADEALLAECQIASGSITIADNRIQKVISCLGERDTIPEDIMESLCRTVCLSESRLSHLFKEQVGIALNRYIVLDKMKKTYLHYTRSGNITEAALAAGFYSSSHFAATCKKMFGLSFSEIMKS